jgi:pseudaminic acid synthase
MRAANKIAENRVYLIAEISANHNGSFDRAKKLVAAAADSGADAVKFQTYTANTLTLKSHEPDFMVEDGLWAGKSLYEIYETGSLPWDWHLDLFEYARSFNLEIISTPFDISAVDFLLKLGVDRLKIASFELIDIPLLERVAQTETPIIVSCGMGNFSEISEAMEILKNNHVTLLHCISNYPANPEEANLKFIHDLRTKFEVEIGLSDHCITNSIACASVAMGVRVIEKHFTLDRDAGGLDDSFSQTPASFTELRNMCDEVSAGLITHSKRTDLDGKRYRKSIYASADIKKGEFFSEKNIKVVRPGFSLHPRFFKRLLGKVALQHYKFGARISEDELL